MRFANFLSGGFIFGIVVNPLERKLALCALVSIDKIIPGSAALFLNINLNIKAKKKLYLKSCRGLMIPKISIQY